MNEISKYRAEIAPVDASCERPIWSVMIPTYNCARYLEETLKSVLSQDPGPELMQIEVVDDCSTKDDPEEIVRRIAGDRVTFYRQPENVGHIANFACCLRRSRGKYVHLLHGDDCVKDGFYRKMQEGFEFDSDVGAGFCRQIYIDGDGLQTDIAGMERNESGVLDNALIRMADDQIVLTPSIVVRRDVYEKLGGFDERLVCAEDWEMWVRIASQYKIWYEVEALALYRMHDNSNTGRHLETGEDRLFAAEAIKIFSEYLPEAERCRVISSAREKLAILCLKKAFSLFGDNHFKIVRGQLRTAFKLHCSLRVIRICVWLSLKTIVRVCGFRQ